MDIDVILERKSRVLKEERTAKVPAFLFLMIFYFVFTNFFLGGGWGLGDRVVDVKEHEA